MTIIPKICRSRFWRTPAGFLILLVLTTGCQPLSPWAQPARQRVDLTHSFDETTIYWPTSKPFHLDVVHKGPSGKGYWYEANNFETAEHGGTHMDAPAHFAENRWTVDEIPLDHLIAEAVLVEVSGKTRADADYLIRIEDFLDWEAKNGRIPDAAIVLVRTGFEAYWPDKKRYLGSSTAGDTAHLHFPGFSEESARFLADERHVVAIGLDTASLDHGPSRDFKAHRVFGQANIVGFENLCNLDRLPARGFRVLALLMKIGGGSGAPLRIVAEVY